MTAPTPSRLSVLTSPETFRYLTGQEIDIKFGMPRHNCRFHGICRLDIQEDDLMPTGPPPKSSGKGWLFIPRVEYCLICIDKNSLDPGTTALQFHREYFVLDGTVPFSPLLAQCIGSKAGLLPGRYRIMEGGKIYGILFRLYIPARSSKCGKDELSDL